MPGLKNGTWRFLDTVSALSAAFALAVPHRQAMAQAGRVGFYQSVKARLVKFDGGGQADGRRRDDQESTIRQIIDKALASDKVVDSYDAAGIFPSFRKNSCGTCGRGRTKTLPWKCCASSWPMSCTTGGAPNLGQTKKLLERLEAALRRYHNKALSAADVLEELISLSKDVRDADKHAQELA